MRHLTTLALAGLFGAFLLVGDASACHKMKKCATPCAPAPVCVAEPVCAPKKTCHFKMPKMHMPKISLCHKKAPVCATYETYSAPMASPQATGQSM